MSPPTSWAVSVRPVSVLCGSRENREAQLVGSSISCFVLPNSSCCDSGVFPPSRLSVCSFGGVCVLNIPCLLASLFPVQTMFPFQYDLDATDVLAWVQINKSVQVMLAGGCKLGFI